MKITLLQEQERRLDMIIDIIQYIDRYEIQLTYPSQIEEFKEDLKDLFKTSIKHMNSSIKVCQQKKIIEKLREEND